MLGLTSRQPKVLLLGLACLVGLSVTLLGWRRYRWASFWCGVLLAGFLAGMSFNVARLRTDSDFHVSILSVQ